MEVPDGKEEAWLKLTRGVEAYPYAPREGGPRSVVVRDCADDPGDKSDAPVLAIVASFRGWPDQGNTDWPGMLKRANAGRDADALTQQTEAARKIVRSEIWQVLEQTDPPAMSTK